LIILKVMTLEVKEIVVFTVTIVPLLIFSLLVIIRLSLSLRMETSFIIMMLIVIVMKKIGKLRKFQLITFTELK